MAITLAGKPVAKKKSSTNAEPRRYGTLIRVSDEFADAIRKASALADVSHSEFADDHLLAIVQRIYRDALAKESKRMGGGTKGGVD